MFKSNVTNPFVTVAILLILVFPINSSFYAEAINYPAPLKFYWMRMTADDARAFARTPEFEYFIFQNKNPDNATGNARHHYELITFTNYTYYDYSDPNGWRPGPHEKFLKTIPVQPPPPNRLMSTDIPNNVNLASFKLTKTELSKHIPPDNTFAYLVFEPLPCADAEEKNYVCYRIYPVNSDGVEIKGVAPKAFSSTMHPSPPAGFD